MLAALGLCALTVLVFSNSFQAGFILDNKGLLLDPRIRKFTTDNLALIFQHSYWWPTGEAGLYRPFTTLSYLFNYAVLGDADQPGGYHAINLLLHTANVLLVCALSLRIVKRFWPSVFVAAVWGVHPVLTESVTNIVGRADLLAALGVLSGFLMYLKSTEATGRAHVAWLVGLMGATAIGVFSKESAVAILPIIVLYELTFSGRALWKDRTRVLGLGCIATALPITAMLFVRAAVLSASPPAEFPFTDNPIVGADWLTARLTAIKVMTHYLWLTIWPAGLSCDYSYNQIPRSHGALGDWLAYAAIAAVAILVALLYRWNRTCFFFTCFAFLNFLPASNLLFPIGTIMAERLLYLPALGLLGCLVIGVFAIEKHDKRPQLARVPPILLGLVVAVLALRTWVRNQDWQNDLAMATSSLRASPNSFKLHQLLAAALFEADPTHTNLDQATEEQEKSASLLDSLPPELSRPEVYRQAGYYNLLRGERTKSAAAYQRSLAALLRCISIDRVTRAAYIKRSASIASTYPPADSQAYFLLSVVYLRLGGAAKAYEAVEQARAVDPLNPQIYRQLGAILEQQGRMHESDIAFLHENAIMGLQEGKWQNVADASERVLRANAEVYPSAYYLNAMANLRLGHYDVAEKNAREAIRLDTTHRNPRASYVLGLALAQKQDLKQSAELLRTYLRTAPTAPDIETVRTQLDEIEKSMSR